MKVMLICGIVLNLLITSAVVAEEAAQKPNKVVEETQNMKNIEICTQNLVAIGEAVEAYKKEHGDFPEWLSELHPKYLPDAKLLLCPADELGGKPIFTSNADPKMSVSYGYQFHPEYRAMKSEERLIYGDVIPLARCRHHKNQAFASLNLSFAFKVFWASGVYTPEEIYGSPEAAITAFKNTLARYPDDQRFLELHAELLGLYIHRVGDEQSADALIERLKSDLVLNIEGYRTVLEVLAEAELYDDLLEIFKVAEQQYPDEQPIHSKLAYIYEKLGNTELAEVYERKSDPKYELWGKSVTDFSATDLDGNPISLQDYRGKVVLLDFWAVWCGPCIKEMPNLKRVYATYKDQGFDIIGVSLDDEESALRDYIKENDLQWRQIYSGERWLDDPLAQQFKITGIPEPWLIDREGKLISHKARGEDLERLVVEALKHESANQ